MNHSGRKMYQGSVLMKKPKAIVEILGAFMLATLIVLMVIAWLPM